MRIEPTYEREGWMFPDCCDTPCSIRAPHQSMVTMTRLQTGVLLLASLTLKPGDGLDIVQHSGDLVIVKEGEDLDLYCETSSPYQWCMWTHNGSGFWSDLLYIEYDTF